MNSDKLAKARNSTCKQSLRSLGPFVLAVCTLVSIPRPLPTRKIASVWTTPWSLFLRKHPDVHLHIVGQWKWGCEVRKPTGLLALRLPFFIRSLHNRALPDARPPATVAIGVGEDGRFRTSAFTFLLCVGWSFDRRDQTFPG